MAILRLVQEAATILSFNQQKVFRDTTIAAFCH